MNCPLCGKNDWTWISDSSTLDCECGFLIYGREANVTKDETQEFLVEPQKILVPRRRVLGFLSPTEALIRQSMLSVEKLGADPKLTEAIVHLGEAFEAVADFVDKEGG